MIEEIEGAPRGVLAYRATGEIDYEEYRRLLGRAVSKASADGRKMRVVVELPPEFTGYSADPRSADRETRLKDLRHFKKCAVVTDHGWVKDVVQGFRMTSAARIELFRLDELPAALDWAAR